jgi:hypothetical protein
MITRLPKTTIQLRRVAAYARVSTDSEEQLTSYEAQVDYYTRYIHNKPDWQFVDVYTDELDEHSLASEVSLARKSGLTVITSDNLSTPILNRHYALKCPWDGAVIPVDRSLTIGRSPTCNLPIPAEYRFVSGLHGQVIQDPNSNSGWSYIDRDSTNGSTLNDNPVSPNEKVPLSPGDRIGLGGVCDVVFGVV